jgi:hypothetical protein
MNLAASAPGGELGESLEVLLYYAVIQCHELVVMWELVTGRGEGSDKQLVAREHFVFSDSESQLYHFSVEGNIIRDGIKIPPEVQHFVVFSLRGICLCI